MRLEIHQRWFCFGCLFELGLVGIAALLSELLRQPLLGALQWHTQDAVWGVLTALPALLLFVWILKSERAFSTTRDFLEEAVRPFFAKWSIWQLAVISLLAGLCEELLFRGVIQGKLTGLLGPAPAVLLTSLLFGCVHAVNLEYVFVAASMGAYFGGVWLANGNLLAPIVAHAFYDFIALVYFLRVHGPRDSARTELH